MKNKTVVVGMSGGVDSSVAAYLLKKQGYDVIGVTMQIWQEEDACTLEHEGGCCGLSAVEDARRVANQLGIPYYVMNFRKEFQENVIDYFVKEYRQGRTPNPCIACNRYVKWESMLHKSLAIGADYIATGHYAKIERLENGRYALRRSVSVRKDQTYALYNLTQEQLSRTLFPVGDYEKEKIREIAERENLLVAHKPDSQDICFVPDHDYAAFIRRRTGQTEIPGDFVDEQGHVLGRHRGIWHYTIGQRKGLNVGGKPEPLFVIATDVERNVLYVGQGQRHPGLYRRGLRILPDEMHWVRPDRALQPGASARFRMRIRYRQPLQDGVLHVTPEGGYIVFDEPQRGVTAGQFASWYDGEELIGSGVIHC